MSKQSRLNAILGISGANAVAALLNVGIVPYMALLFSPQQYGSAAAVLLVSGILATVVSGRYEVGASVAEHSASGRTESAGLARLSLGLAAASSAVMQAVVEVWLLVSEGPGGVWRWMPILTFVTAAGSTEILLDARAGRYRALSWLVISRPVIIFGGLWAMSFVAESSANVLCLIYLLSTAAPAVRAIWITRSNGASPRLEKSYIRLAAEQSRYPKFQVPAALLNVLATSIYGLVIAWSFGAAALGAFTLATRLTFLPVTIAGGPINTLFLRELVIAKENLTLRRKYYLTALLVSFLVGVLAVPVVVAGGPLVEELLGSEWGELDEYLAVTLPLMGALLIAAPVNNTLVTYERQRALLGWRIALVAGPGATLLAGSALSLTAPVSVAVASSAALVISCLYASFGWSLVAAPPRQAGGAMDVRRASPS